MHCEYETANGRRVIGFASGEKNGERHYWFHPEGDEAETFTLSVVEVRRLVATSEWTPLG